EDEHAVRREVVACAGERLAREEERLKTNVRARAHERKRVGEREHDQVIPIWARAQERTPVIDVLAHARIGVRMIWMLALAELEAAPITNAQVASTNAALTSVKRVIRRASARPPSRSARIPNQTGGCELRTERPVNRAMPPIDPTMSRAYARSGGIARSREPSGNASAAMTAATRTNTSGSTTKLVSAAWLSARPKKT